MAGHPAVRAFLGPRLAGKGDRLLTEASPVAQVTSDDPPHLIIYGDRDPVARYVLSLQYLQALQRAAVPGRLLTIPGGDHGGKWSTRG